jgi:hypothetical protein
VTLTAVLGSGIISHDNSTQGDGIMDDDQILALVKAVHRKEIERLQAAGKSLLAPPEPAVVPHTELPEAKPGSVFYHEWNTYRREVGRLLAEGNEGKWLVIKGDAILGIFDTMQQANSAGLALIIENKIKRPFALRQVLAKEPILKLRGYNLPWPSSPFPPAQTA